MQNFVYMVFCNIALFSISMTSEDDKAPYRAQKGYFSKHKRLKNQMYLENLSFIVTVLV